MNTLLHWFRQLWWSLKKHPEYQYLRIIEQLVFKFDHTPKEQLQHGPQDTPAVNIGLTRMRFYLGDGEFPLFTTRKHYPKSSIVELLWHLSGSSLVEWLHRYGVHFWDKWAAKEVAEKYGLQEGDVGRIYGPNWRHFRAPPGDPRGEIDQIAWVVEGLKKNPEWRRWWVSAWNPPTIDQSILVPCHGTFHLILVDGRLNLHHFQRSGDILPGVSVNVAMYALLLLLICQVTGLKPGWVELIVSDTHMYVDQIEAAREMLKRKPYPFPSVWINPEITNIFEFKPDDIRIENYKSHKKIEIPVAL